MKKMIKPLVFVMLAALLTTLLVIPNAMPAKITPVPGDIFIIFDIWICLCPGQGVECYCVVGQDPKD